MSFLYGLLCGSLFVDFIKDVLKSSEFLLVVEILIRAVPLICLAVFLILVLGKFLVMRNVTLQEKLLTGYVRESIDKDGSLVYRNV